MNAFPQTIHFIGSNMPRRAEISVRDLEVEGEIPAEIDGAFFRAVPDNAHAPMFEDDIALNADGMIAASTSRAARSITTSSTSRPSATSPRRRPAARCSAATAIRSPTIPSVAGVDRTRLQHHAGLARRPAVHDQGGRARLRDQPAHARRPPASGTTTARSSPRPSPPIRGSIRSPASCSSSATRRAGCAASTSPTASPTPRATSSPSSGSSSPIARRSTIS